MKNLKIVNLFGVVFKITLLFFQPFFFSESFCSDSLKKIKNQNTLKDWPGFSSYNPSAEDNQKLDYLGKKTRQLEIYLLNQKNSNTDYVQAINKTIDHLCMALEISPFFFRLNHDLFLNDAVKRADKKEISNAIGWLRVYFSSNYFYSKDRKNYTEHYMAMENYNEFITMFLARKIYLSAGGRFGGSYTSLELTQKLARSHVIREFPFYFNLSPHEDNRAIALCILQNNQEYVEQNLENKKKSQNPRIAAIKFISYALMHRLLIEGFIKKGEEIGHNTLKQFFMIPRSDITDLDQAEKYLKSILHDILFELATTDIEGAPHSIEVNIRDQLDVLSKFIKYEKISPFAKYKKILPKF